MIDYYNQKEFLEANELFEKEIEKLQLEDTPEVEFTETKISTITSIIKLCDFINIKILFNRMELDDTFVYIKYKKNDIRGIKENIKAGSDKKNTDKRMKNKGICFSNQISLGIKCPHEEHQHKNPMSVKIFKNGNMQMTGCKNNEEIYDMYERIYKKIISIPKTYFYLDKKIDINFYKNIIEPEKMEFKNEMIISTFKINCNINQKKFNEKISSVYDNTKVYTIFQTNTYTPLRIYPKLLGFVNEKGKEKIPTIFVYNTGSINLICPNLKILDSVYLFITQFIEKYQKDIIEENFTYDF